MSQHMDALAKANSTRLFRAEVCREVADGKRMAADVLYSEDGRLQRMQLFRLICAIRRVNERTAKAMLRGYCLHENITLDRLSPRTRASVSFDLRELQERRDARRQVAS